MNINPFDILKNAQKLQEQMSGFQEKLGEIVVTGSAAGGLVEIDLNGKLEALAVRIAPQAMEGSDTEMLQDLITAAITDAITKTKAAISSEAAAMSGGLLPQGSMPPGFSGIFGSGA